MCLYVVGLLPILPIGFMVNLNFLQLLVHYMNYTIIVYMSLYTSQEKP